MASRNVIEEAAAYCSAYACSLRNWLYTSDYDWQGCIEIAAALGTSDDAYRLGYEAYSIVPDIGYMWQRWAEAASMLLNGEIQ